MCSKSIRISWELLENNNKIIENLCNYFSHNKIEVHVHSSNNIQKVNLVVFMIIRINSSALSTH